MDNHISWCTSIVKPGKGTAFTRTKLKNMISGNVLEEPIELVKPWMQPREDRNMMYMYDEGELVFMDNETFETVNVSTLD